MKRLTLITCFISMLVLQGYSQKRHTFKSTEKEALSKVKDGQHESTTSNEPGKCYAKCLIPNKHESNQKQVYLYTGDNYDQEHIKYIKREISPASTQWVKKRASDNCLSTNPDDCLVWCLQEVPANFKEYFVVLDTNLVKDFGAKVRQFEEGDQDESEFTEWKEVLCENKKTPELVESVHAELYALGYDVKDKHPKKFNKKMKRALIEFQKDNQLPRGQLDFETLELLGVSY